MLANPLTRVCHKSVPRPGHVVKVCPDPGMYGMNGALTRLCRKSGPLDNDEKHIFDWH